MVLYISIVSGITQFLGYLLYAKGTFLNKIKPNAASWSIWAFGAVLESLSYVFLTNDPIKNILPLVCAFSAVGFFVLCAVRGYFGKISGFERTIVVADIVILIIWFFTKSPLYANLLLVLTAIISFVPIVINVYKNPVYENAFPWFVWTLAYFLQSIVVLSRFVKVEDLVYPLTFLCLHIVVAVLSLDFRKRKYQLAIVDLSGEQHPEHL